MKRYRIIFQPEAVAQLKELKQYLEIVASPDVGGNYVRAVLEYCDTLSEFPNRGTLRDDVGPGFRCISFRRRTAIIFTVEAETVEILGIFHGGQNWEASFTD